MAAYYNIHNIKIKGLYLNRVFRLNNEITALSLTTFCVAGKGIVIDDKTVVLKFSDKSQMEGEGFPSGVIRFASHLPFGYLAFTGINLYNDVTKLEVFRVLPHGATFLKGLQIVGQAV